MNLLETDFHFLSISWYILISKEDILKKERKVEAKRKKRDLVYLQVRDLKKM